MLRRNRFARLSCLALAATGLVGCSGTIDFGDGVLNFMFNFPRLQREESTEALDLTGVEKLKVVSSNGAVLVRVDESNDPEATFEKFAFGRDETSAKQLLDAIEIAIEKTGDTLCITVTLPDPQDDAEAARRHHGGQQTVGVSMDISLPEGLELDLTNANGLLTVDSNTGPVRARMTNGIVRVQEQTGDVDAETVNGFIKLRNVTGNVRALTTNGAISIRATLPDDGSIDAQTTNGPIHIRIQEEYAGKLDLAAVNGRVFADLDGFSPTNEVVENDKVEADLNGGGPGQVFARTTNGPIRFNVDSHDDDDDDDKDED